MPPFLPNSASSPISDLHISSLELDRRSSLHPREIPPPPAGPQPPGTINPYAVNNSGVLALFALLSAGLVLTSIWFFFWAKNGGFVFREGDWEDYKSTVLRRKDKDGRTLSNATKTTDLGGGSLNAEHEHEHDHGRDEGLRGGGGDSIFTGRRSRRDNDMREYRHEKPARVGGLNRKPDAYYTDTEASLVDATPPKATKPKTKPKKEPKQPQMKETTTTSKTSRFFFQRADKTKPAAKRAPEYQQHHRDVDTYTEVSSAPTDATPPPRRHHHHHHHNGTHRAVPQASPSSSPRHKHSQRRYEPSESGYTASSGYGDGYTVDGEGDGDLGTKTYRHTIPGLSVAGSGTRAGKAMTESSFERGERRGKEGYRRGGDGGGGGRGRRDSLSDSD
jgi:hypothetical protein